MNNGERLLCEYQYDMTGGFFTSLIGAMMRADITNTAKLMGSYPELMEAVHKFKNEVGYWERLEEEWQSPPAYKPENQ